MPSESLNINHLLLKNGSGGTASNPTMPTAANLEKGELAVNYLASGETIIVKNSNDGLAKFSSDQALIRNKIGSRFADGGDYSGATVQEVIVDNEQVVAAALNALSGAIASISSMLSTVISDVETLKNSH